MAQSEVHALPLAVLHSLHNLPLSLQYLLTTLEFFKIEKGHYWVSLSLVPAETSAKANVASIFNLIAHNRLNIAHNRLNIAHNRLNIPLTNRR